MAYSRSGTRHRGAWWLALTAGIVGCDRDEGAADGEPAVCTAVACQAAEQSDLVADTEWLAAQGEAAVLIDTRSSAAYEAGHLPGALHLDPDATRTTVDGVAGQVAELDTVEAALREAGVPDAASLVVYGAASEPGAARLVWTLQYFGHDDVHLLDGGFDVWSGATESGAPAVTASDWQAAGPASELRVDVDWIVPRLDDPSVVLIDARTREEYDVGHLPGALSIDWQSNVVDGAYKPVAEVAALYADIDRDATVVTYCQTGVRASLTWLTLRWLGYEDVRVYDGSWAEWGSRDDLPRE